MWNNFGKQFNGETLFGQFYRIFGGCCSLSLAFTLIFIFFEQVSSHHLCHCVFPFYSLIYPCWHPCVCQSTHLRLFIVDHTVFLATIIISFPLYQICTDIINDDWSLLFRFLFLFELAFCHCESTQHIHLFCRYKRNKLSAKCFHLMSYFWNRSSIILNQLADRDADDDHVDVFTHFMCVHFI